jgi:hypothetical protein
VLRGLELRCAPQTAIWRGCGIRTAMRSGAVAATAQEPEHIFIAKRLEIFGGNVGLVEKANAWVVESTWLLCLRPGNPISSVTQSAGQGACSGRRTLAISNRSQQAPVRIAAHVRDASLTNLGGERRAKPVPPEPDVLVADLDPALSQQILDIAQRQRVSHVHHHDQTASSRPDG